MIFKEIYLGMKLVIHFWFTPCFTIHRRIHTGRGRGTPDKNGR